MRGLCVSFVFAFVRMFVPVQSGLFVEVFFGGGEGSPCRGSVVVLLPFVCWRRAWAFIVVCVSGLVGGVVCCAVAVVLVVV